MKFLHPRRGLIIFLSDIASRPALWPNQPAYPMGTMGSFSSGKAAGAWSYTSTPQFAIMAWCSVTIKRRYCNQRAGSIVVVSWRQLWLKCCGMS